VVIGNSRIIGTLVLLNPGGNTAVQGPILWEPALPNLPVLLTDKAITIGFDAATALNEASLGVNFNPSGSPYPYVGGTSNSTAADAYPSKINGLVYTSSDLVFDVNSSINGLVVVDGKITFVSGAALTLQYSNVYFNSPPPGFLVGQVPIKTVAGSWKRVVD